MSLRKLKSKGIFLALLFLSGIAFISSFIDGKVSAKDEKTSNGAAISQYFTADVSGGGNVVGNATYKVFDNGDKDFSFFLLVSNIANGTTLTVEIDNVVVAQPVVSAGQISGTVESPAPLPPVSENSVVTVKNGTQTLSSGTFRLTVIRPLTIYVAEGAGSKVLPPVNSEAIATGILLIEEGSSLAEVLVIGTAFDSAPLSVTINGPANVDENGPVVFNFDNIQSFPNNGKILFLARGFVQLTPLFRGQLNENLLYIDVKTPEFPNGEVRGQFGLYTPNADFEGDGISDISVFRPTDGNWYLLNSSNRQVRGISFGRAGDKIVPGDFDGDNITDLAAFRKVGEFGFWSVRCSSDGRITTTQWGLKDDIPVVADYDGDGRDDLIVFRPSNGTWYVRRSSDVIKPFIGEDFVASFDAVKWGQSGDVPFASDFDGDGKPDLMVYRPSNGTWYGLRSTNGGIISRQWGNATDIPLVGDFDGSGRADIGVFRPSNGTWYVLNELTQPQFVQFGTNGDVPTVADYDGDGHTDFTVFRPSNGTWYGLKSANNEFFATKFGQNGDVPTAAP